MYCVYVHFSKSFKIFRNPSKLNSGLFLGVLPTPYLVLPTVMPWSRNVIQGVIICIWNPQLKIFKSKFIKKVFVNKLYSVGHLCINGCNETRLSRVISDTVVSIFPNGHFDVNRPAAVWESHDARLLSIYSGTTNK